MEEISREGNEQYVRIKIFVDSIMVNQATVVWDRIEEDVDFLKSNKVWIANGGTRPRIFIKSTAYASSYFTYHPHMNSPLACSSSLHHHSVHTSHIQPI